MISTYPLALTVAVLGTAEVSKVRTLTLMLHLLAKLSKRAIWAVLSLANWRRRCMEVRCLGLAEVRRRTTNVLSLSGLLLLLRLLLVALRGTLLERIVRARGGGGVLAVVLLVPTLRVLAVRRAVLRGRRRLRGTEACVAAEVRPAVTVAVTLSVLLVSESVPRSCATAQAGGVE